MQRADRGWKFIDLAELGINTRRSYTVSALHIVLLPLGLIALAVFAFVADRSAPKLFSGEHPFVELIILDGAIVAFGIATIWSVVRVHCRPWRSLVSFDLTLDWGRLAIGAGVEVALTAGVFHPLGLVNVTPDFAVAASVPLLLLALAVIPLQATSEELLFRGYLTQALGRLLRSRIAIAVIVGLVFAVLHGNEYGPWTMPYMLLVSLIYTLVSLRDGRIELAIGSHAANNLLSFGSVGLADDTDLTWNDVALVPVYGAAFYGLTRLLVRLCRGEQSDG